MGKYFYVLSALVLVACGKQNDESINSQGQAVVFQGGQTCSSSVIEDHNRYILSCVRFNNMNQARACKEQAENMLVKYPGLNCALPASEGGKERSIQEKQIQFTLRKLKKIGV